MTDITDEQLAEWWDRASRLAAKDGGGVAWFESKLRRFAELARQEEREAWRADWLREVEPLRQNAERYRVLRDDPEWDCFDSRWLHKHDLYGQTGADLDAAIDATIRSRTSRGQT